ncbi:MAG: sigma-70 family RNA polymerase sigma factor [Candidatus Rokubacteria bacterium]|nr:sigma-70 family RNA polymerase sigma factor [Candidatus Rokubacteria bacterium]
MTTPARHPPDGGVRDRRDSGRARPDRIAHLGQSRERFRRFLERRLGSRADAEDLLQAAFLKVLAWEDALRDEDRGVPWFYQLLRNLLADHHRERAARARLATRLAAESPTSMTPDDALFRAVCACVRDVVGALRPSQAALLRRLEVEELPLRQAAAELGITPSTAAVRRHRARRALLEALRATCGACAEHHCVDCSCRHAPRVSPPGPV